jgi:type IV pilus assembly protein PilC
MVQTTFAYKVRDGEGKLLEGTLEAENGRLVVTRLREMGYTPLNIEAKRSNVTNKELHLPGLGGRVPQRELAVFSRQFATLINSGMTLIRALTILVEQAEHPVLSRVVAQVRVEVERGVSLSAALKEHPKAFNELYVAMVRAGEASGSLDKALLSLAESMEKQVKLRGEIKSALAYPVAALGIVVVIATAMLLFIVPIFRNIYKSLNGTLPLPTRILIEISSIMVKFFPIVLLVIVLLVVGLRFAIKTPNGRVAWDTTKLKVPVFGILFRKTALSRFSSTFGALLGAGVPVLEALEITRDAAGNQVVAKGIDSVITAVRRGDPIGSGLRAHDVFPAMMLHMIGVGEETGSLDDMLGKVSAFLDGEIERMVASLTSLLEPLLIVILGGAVGAMVICLYLPMFNVDKLVNQGQ